MMKIKPLGHAFVVAAALALAICLAGPASAQETEKEKTDEGTVNVVIKTSMGDITLELDQEKAPITVNNFLAYVEEGFYDGTIFHRVIPDFMIQGGGFTPDMAQKETQEGIENEWQNGLKNMNGTIAMARVGGNPNSATSQFFINVKDNTFLDRPQRDGAGYAVFGKVIDGMDVVDKIKAVKTTTKGMHANVPVDPVVIEKVVIVDEAEAEDKPEKKPEEKSDEGQ